MAYTLPYKKFGLSSTYSPFTNSYPITKNIDITMKLPDSQVFIDEPYIVLETGLIPEVTSFFNGNINFTIEKKDGQSIKLVPRVGTTEIGQSLFPEKNEIVWFDKQGIQGDYYIHSDYAGENIHIQGDFMVSALESKVFNELVSSTGNDITDLQNNLSNINTTLKRERLKIEIEEKTYTWAPSVYRSSVDMNVSNRFNAPSGTIGILGHRINALSLSVSWDKRYFPYYPNTCNVKININGVQYIAQVQPTPQETSISASFNNNSLFGGGNATYIDMSAYGGVKGHNNGSMSINTNFNITVWWLKQINY